MSDEQKQLTGKPKYWGRVDIKAMIDPVAEVRRIAIEEIKKYPESMRWNDIPIEHFFDAIQRHCDAIREENNPAAIDPDTGLPHYYAIGFNYMVISMKLQGREYDV